MKADQYIFTTALILVACSLGYLLLPAYAEYQDAKREHQKLEEKLMRLDYQYQEIQADIYALKNYPQAIERVAREKFGWCREDEKIYHFDPPANYLGGAGHSAESPRF